MKSYLIAWTLAGLSLGMLGLLQLSLRSGSLPLGVAVFVVGAGSAIGLVGGVLKYLYDKRHDQLITTGPWFRFPGRRE